jgi:hypothetical protein
VVYKFLLQLQRYNILFICGDNSCILSRLNRDNTSVEVRRAFTSFKLMTIQVENHHSFLIVEHNPLLYEDAGKWWSTWPRPLGKPPGRSPSCSTRSAGPSAAGDIADNISKSFCRLIIESNRIFIQIVLGG